MLAGSVYQALPKPEKSTIQSFLTALLQISVKVCGYVLHSHSDNEKTQFFTVLKCLNAELSLINSMI